MRYTTRNEHPLFVTTTTTDTAVVRLEATDLGGEPPMVATEEVHDTIRATIGTLPAETGGILGGSRAHNVVTHFRLDTGSNRTQATYSPDVASMNRILRDHWNPQGIDFMGFVHSHPGQLGSPSGGDRQYAQRILEQIPDLDRMLMPIVRSTAGGPEYAINPAVAHRGPGRARVTQVPMQVVRGYGPDPRRLPEFERIRSAVDLGLMSRTRLIIVGVGGAAGFVESMARMGIGEFVLIDPDVVEAANVATQQAYRHDIGSPKVDAVAHRLVGVSPHTRVATFAGAIDDLDDEQLRRLARHPLPNSRITHPDVTVLCAFTDSFDAQKRVNRLALNVGLPMIAAQVWEGGKAVEVSFSAPGVTPACGRCVLGQRYRAYEKGYTNTVGTAGASLWATEWLNALKQAVVLALVHGTDPKPSRHPGARRYSNMLEQIAHRNLIVSRLDPTLVFPSFERALAGADATRLFAGETVWLPQEPEGPASGFDPCPDCGGTGDLNTSVDSFADTRTGRTLIA